MNKKERTLKYKELRMFMITHFSDQVLLNFLIPKSIHFWSWTEVSYTKRKNNAPSALAKLSILSNDVLIFSSLFICLKSLSYQITSKYFRTNSLISSIYINKINLDNLMSLSIHKLLIRIKSNRKKIQCWNLLLVLAPYIASLLPIYWRFPAFIIPGWTALLYHLKSPCGL